MGKTPLEVWSRAQRERPPDDLNEDTLRQALTIRVRRRVRKDSTLSLDGQVLELDAGFLAGHTVTVARSLLDRKEPPWVEHEGQNLVLHPVDPIKNARRPRPSQPAQTVSSTSFDPAGVLLDRAVGRPPRHRDRKGDLR